MGDGLGNFQREDETGRGLVGPSGDGGARRCAVKGAIYFDGIEFRGVVGEKVERLRSGGVKRAFPTCRGECGRAYADIGISFRRHDGRA